MQTQPVCVLLASMLAPHVLQLAEPAFGEYDVLPLHEMQGVDGERLLPALPAGQMLHVLLALPP